MEACSFLQGRRQQGLGHLPTFLASLRFCSPLAASVGPNQDLNPPHRLVLPVPCPLLTCSLYSLRLRMTAVICWSMKMRMVTRTAGTADTRQTHHGLAPKGKTIQPRAGFVGCGEQEGHGSCHPLVGCAVQLGDGTSPRCPGWSPTGTQGCPTLGVEEHPHSSWGCSWAECLTSPPQGHPSCGRAGCCSWTPQARSWACARDSRWKRWPWAAMMVSPRRGC